MPRHPAPAATDWPAIAGLYAELEELTGSPVVRLNRAVAVAEAEDRPPPSPCSMTSTTSSATAKDLAAVRGELFDRLGRRADSAAAFEAAIALATNEAERAHLAAPPR